MHKKLLIRNHYIWHVLWQTSPARRATLLFARNLFSSIKCLLLPLCLLLQGSWWKRSMAKPQHQLGESHSLTSSSPTWLSVFTIAVSHVLFHLGPLVSTDSLFIFISRQLCGKCPVMDSCSTTGHKLPVVRWYLTGTLPSRCTQRSFLFLSRFFAPQGPPGGGGPPGTPIMPSPGGELYTSVSLLISTFIWRSLNKGSV